MTQYPEWVKKQVRERLAAGETQNQPQELFVLSVSIGAGHTVDVLFLGGKV